MFYKKDPTGFDTVVDPPQIPILMVLNFSIDFMFQQQIFLLINYNGCPQFVKPDQKISVERKLRDEM